MIRRFLLVAGLPLLIGAVGVVLVGWVVGSMQWGLAAAAFGLRVPTGLVSVVLTDYLGRRSPFGRLLGLMIGVGLRLVVGFGGAAVVVFLVLPDDRRERVGFLGWVLFAYLVTLVIETVVLARPAPAGAVSRPRAG